MIQYKMSLKNFDVQEVLGKGAYSTVYKVKRTCNNELYALKKVDLLSLNEKQRENALNQIRILASVQNPYVIKYKDSFIDHENHTLCLITQYADNGDLQQRIKKAKKNFEMIPEWEIWHTLSQILKGLRALHAANIVHRDLKCANIFLFQNGNVKIGDMNVSKIIKNHLCETQTGTPYYASPQVWRDLPYNTKSDIWSLGCIIYQMANLHPPFQAESMEILYKIVVKGVYPKLSSEYSSQLRNTIRFMLQLNPSNRLSASKALIIKGELLQSPIFYQKLKQKQNQQTEESIQLIQTIKMPRKKPYLKMSLPKPNYGNCSIEKKKSLNLFPCVQIQKKRISTVKKIKSEYHLPSIFTQKINR